MGLDDDHDHDHHFDTELERQADFASKNNLKEVDNMFKKMSDQRDRNQRGFVKAYNFTQMQNLTLTAVRQGKLLNDKNKIVET